MLIRMFNAFLALLPVMKYAALAEFTNYSLENFNIYVDIEKCHIEVFGPQNYLLWRTINESCSFPFLYTGLYTESKPPIFNGNYQLDESVQFETSSMILSTINQDSVSRSLNISGILFMNSGKAVASYILSFYVNAQTPFQLLFNITLTPIACSSVPCLNRLFLRYWASNTEGFYGFGESFTYLDLRGLRIPVLVSEQVTTVRLLWILFSPFVLLLLL